MSQKPKDITGRMFISDILRHITTALDANQTVTRFVLNAPNGDCALEFEVCVKRIGKTRVPRITKPMEVGKPA